jgi:uncharacterized protein (DUF1330 family)
MSVYVIAQIEIQDAAEYRKYEAGFVELVARYRGEILVAEDHPRVLEGEWNCSRTAVVRFRGEREARLFFESPENQMLDKIRLRSSKNNMIFARGLR